MSAPAERRFAALVDHEGVYLAEFHRERGGIRIVDQWSDTRRADTIDVAVERLRELLLEQKARRMRLAIALQHFGAVFHEMALPPAADEVLRPIIAREVQRVHGIVDPVVAYDKVAATARPGADRPAARSGSQQILIAGAPRTTVDALSRGLADDRIVIDGVTIVPQALRRVFEAMPHSDQATAVLASLRSGPHLAFFLGGDLRLSIDPPLALEGESDGIAAAVSQVDRGVRYFRQQFGGAEPATLLLAASSESYETLAAALQQRVGAAVQPLFRQMRSAEAVVAMGAALDTGRADALDLYPHPPTFADRARAALSGTRGLTTAAYAVAAASAIWAAAETAQVYLARRAVESANAAVGRAFASTGQLQSAAVGRAEYSEIVRTVTSLRDRRQHLVSQLASISDSIPSALTFDSLSVVSAQAGWEGNIGGRVVAPKTADAVKSVNSFYEALRALPGISATTLDQFDFPAARDTTAAAETSGITIHFRVSFTMSPTGETR